MKRPPQPGAAPAEAAQRWDPDRYARNARFVADMAGPVVELLDPRPGERILDLGCGDGALTERLAAMGVDVIGVDASAEQVAAARARGLDARVADAAELPFTEAFDAVFSNAVLHWVRRQDAALDGIRRALRPGGRFVAELGGHGNVAAIRRALVAALDRRGLDGQAAVPWYFPTPEAYREKLESHGFVAESIALVERPTPLPGDMAGWLATFAEPFTALLPEAERPAFVAEVTEALRPALCDAEGRWVADYVRLRLRAHRPA